MPDPMTDTLDMDAIGELAESICAQLAAHAERADLDTSDLAAACALAAGMFLLGDLNPADARQAWDTLSGAVRAFLDAVGDDHAIQRAN